MKKVMVTAVGGDVGQAIVAAVQGVIPDAFVVGTDVNGNNAGHLLTDEFHILPRADSSSYTDALVSLLDVVRPDLLIPVSEPELQKIVVDNEFASLSSVKLIAPDRRSVEVGLDKFRTIEFLDKRGIEHPWTVLSTEGARSFPCVMKDRRGCGSKSVYTIEDSCGLAGRQLTSESVLQEYLDGSEYTCGVFRASDVTRTIALKREMRGGLTSSGVVENSKEISEMLVSVAESLNLNGSINVQLRLTNVGPRIFEINPRFSSTTFFRHCLGFEDLRWSIENTCGDSLSEYRTPRSGTRFFRTSGVAIDFRSSL